MPPPDAVKTVSEAASADEMESGDAVSIESGDAQVRHTKCRCCRVALLTKKPALPCVLGHRCSLSVTHRLMSRSPAAVPSKLCKHVTFGGVVHPDMGALPGSGGGAGASARHRGALRHHRQHRHIDSDDTIDTFVQSIQIWARCRAVAVAQVLEYGIAAHSVIIGIALGVSASPCTIRPLAAALVFHQLFEGIALGATLIGAGCHGWVSGQC